MLIYAEARGDARARCAPPKKSALVAERGEAANRRDRLGPQRRGRGCFRPSDLCSSQLIFGGFMLPELDPEYRSSSGGAPPPGPHGSACCHASAARSTRRARAGGVLLSAGCDPAIAPVGTFAAGHTRARSCACSTLERPNTEASSRTGSACFAACGARRTQHLRSHFTARRSMFRQTRARQIWG